MPLFDTKSMPSEAHGVLVVTELALAVSSDLWQKCVKTAVIFLDTAQHCRKRC